MVTLWIIVFAILLFIGYLLYNMWVDSESRIATYLCKLYFMRFQLAYKENGQMTIDIHKEVCKTVAREYLGTLGWDTNRLNSALDKIDEEIDSTSKIHIKHLIQAIFEQQWPFLVHYMKTKEELMAVPLEKRKRLIAKRHKIIDDSFDKIIGSKL